MYTASWRRLDPLLLRTLLFILEFSNTLAEHSKMCPENPPIAPQVTDIEELTSPPQPKTITKHSVGRRVKVRVTFQKVQAIDR